MQAPLQALTRLYRRFLKGEGGIVAVEFALILPIMVTLYFGVIALTNGYATKHRVESVSRVMSDLVGRLKNKVVTPAEIDGIATAAAAIMAPYDPQGMLITLASVVVRPVGTSYEGKICWSTSRRIKADGTLAIEAPPAAYAKGKVVTVPAGYNKLLSSSYIVSEVKHTYKPVIGKGITGDIAMRDEVPWPVRNVQQIEWTGQGPCPTV
jgi:Flp pilus assembly protein TadG